MSTSREALVSRTRLAQHARAPDDTEIFPLQAGAPPMGRAAACLTFAHAPHDPHSERMRALRTELLLRQDGRYALAVAVVSPCRGEGRSQLAAELAIALAGLGRPTLLIDADLRHPRQHILFGLDNDQGLADALSTDNEPAPRAVVGLPQLAVLNAGRELPNPLELLVDQRFHALVEDWRTRYAYLVFDTPPVGDYSDGLAVSSLVGDVLTLTRAQHTPYREARDLLRRLAATHARVLGAVINHF